MSLRIAFLALSLAAATIVSGAEIPRPSPPYTFKLPNGQQINVQQYKGKVVALEFLLTTCPHCVRTSSVLTKLHSQYGAKGFQPLGVAINDNADIPGFIKQTGASYPIGTANRDTVYGYLQQSILSPNLMMPQLVIIDKNGVIQAQYAGTDPFFNEEEKNIKNWIDKLIGGTAPKSAPAAKSATKKGKS